MSTPEYVNEVAEREEFRRKHLHEGLHFKDLKNFPLIQRKLRGTKGAHFSLADYTTIDAHISEIAPGGHNNKHRHMNEALIFILSGRGHSIIQPPDGPEQRVEWEEGDLFSPPLNWWHQHFNDDPDKPARYLAITNVPLMTSLNAFTKEQWRPADEA